MTPALAIVLAASLAAEPSHNPYLRQAEEQIHGVDEEAALVTLDRARNWPGNTPADRAQIYLLTGLAYAGLALEKPATAAFKSALELEPTLTLPSEVSPRVKGWWASARTEFMISRGATASPAPPRPVMSGKRWTAVGIGVAALAAVGVGIAVGARAGSLSAQAATPQVRIPTAEALYATASTDSTRANALFGAGAGAGLIAAALFIWGAPSP